MSKNNNKNNQSPVNDNSGVIEKIHTELINVLSIIFLNEKTVRFLQTNDTFKKIIVKLLFIGKCLESKYLIKKDDNNIENSILAYENITKSNFDKDVVNYDIKFSLSGNSNNDSLEVTDEINWVKTFLFNSIHLNWDDLISATTPINNSELVSHTANQMNNDNVETVNANKVNNDEYQQNNSWNNQRHYQNAEDFLFKNNISLDSVANQIIDRQATILLERDISNGKFYQYDSKPKFFPSLKLGLLGLWVGFFVIFLVYCIYQFLLADKFYQLKADLGQNVNGIVTIQSSQFNLNNFFNSGNVSIASILFLVMFLFLASMFIYKMFSNWKNQNTKYSFKSLVSWLIVFIGFIVVIIPTFSRASILTYYQQIVDAIDIPPTNIVVESNNFQFSVNNKADFPMFQAYFILTILIIVLVGLIVIWTVLMLIMKPKFDYDRMNAKLEQYRNDIKDGRIIVDENGNSNSGFFNGSKSPFSPF